MGGLTRSRQTGHSTFILERQGEETDLLSLGPLLVSGVCWLVAAKYWYLAFAATSMRRLPFLVRLLPLKHSLCGMNRRTPWDDLAAPSFEAFKPETRPLSSLAEELSGCRAWVVPNFRSPSFLWESHKSSSTISSLVSWVLRLRKALT